MGTDLLEHSNSTHIALVGKSCVLFHLQPQTFRNSLMLKYTEDIDDIGVRFHESEPLN